MKDLTKAQITVGLLSYFTTVWGHVLFRTYEDIVAALGLIFVQFILMLILAYIIMFLLQWVRLFDLKTNTIITLLVLIGLGITISTKITI